MNVAALAIMLAGLAAVSLFLDREARLERDAEERQIREWGNLKARRTAAEIAETEEAKMQREELIATWATLR